MKFEDARHFLEKNHRCVVSTHRPDGAAHSSIVVCGAYQEQAVFASVHQKSVKVHNLRGDPRCTVLAVTNNWHSFVTIEGEASLFDYSNSEPEEIRILLREVFRACGDKDHSNWEEYDQAMRDQKAVAVLVRPRKVYGLVR
jgi:PPOX class probable F420-dependent enzyme